MKNKTFDIPFWFDNIIENASSIGVKFQEQRVHNFLQHFPPFKKDYPYLAFTNPFSKRLDFYITRKNLTKYSFNIMDNYGSKSIGGPNPKFVLSHESNQLIRLKDGFYYFCCYESDSTGSNNSELVIFINENGIEWTKKKIIKTIQKFSKELSEFQEKKRVEKADPKAFDRIFLPGKMVEDIKNEVQNFLSSRKIYAEDLQLPWKRGLLFAGKPGNGKTSLLRAICNYFGLEFKDIKDSIKRNGDIDLPAASEDGIDTILYPTANDVTVWIMEDIDKLVDFNGDKESISSSVSLHDVLKGLDGINQIDGALVLATTNYANILTESLANRPGRFDRIFEIKVPESNEIVRMLQFHKIEIADGHLDIVAQKMDGFNMAFVEEFVKSVKMIYKRNSISKEEAKTVLDRILKHNKDFENKFAEEKGGFGFGK